MSECLATKVDSQPKYLNINDAIYDADSVIIRLRELRIRIDNGDIPEPNKASVPRTMPSLTNFLIESPDVIRKQTEEAHKLIDEINQLLF